MMKAYQLNPNEAYLIDLVRSIKNGDGGHGFGEVITEIADGIETFFRPRYSFQAPLRK